MPPKVSIIITCYDLGAYLQEALDSIAEYPAQGDIEVVIVDDGSTDPATVQVLDGLDRDRYTIIRQTNTGLGQARNNGIRAASGAYIIPLDADNRLRPALISRTIKVLEADPRSDIVYGNAEYFGEREGLWQVGPFGFQRLLVRNFMDACAGFRRSLWERIGGYDQHMPTMGYEDWDFWLRSAVAGAKFQYMDEVLFDYRVRSGSMLATTMANRDQLVDHIFNKPELAFLKELRVAHLELVDKNVGVQTGRTLLRALKARLLDRITGRTSNTGGTP